MEERASRYSGCHRRITISKGPQLGLIGMRVRERERDREIVKGGS